MATKSGRNLRLALGLMGLTLILAVSSTGCASSHSQKGTVYEWTNPPAGGTGQIYVDPEPKPQGSKTLPLDNASISFFAPITIGCTSTVHEYYNIGGDCVSDARGSFSGDLALGFGQSSYMKIVVEKSGYYPVEKIFVFSKGTPLRFDVLLVRQPASQQ